MLEPWKYRLVQEYRELQDRIVKLSKMLKKYKEGTLDFTPNCPYELLHEQLIYMKNYLRVLTERAKLEFIAEIMNDFGGNE